MPVPGILWVGLWDERNFYIRDRNNSSSRLAAKKNIVSTIRNSSNLRNPSVQERGIVARALPNRQKIILERREDLSYLYLI